MKKKLHVLFCGSYIPTALTKEIEFCSEAGNNLQHNLIMEMSKYSDIRILSYIGYPVSALQKNILKQELKKNSIQHVICKRGLDRIWDFFKYYKLLLCNIKKIDVILLYNYQYLQILIPVIGIVTGKETAIIIADYTDASEEKGILRKLLAWHTEVMYGYFSKAIILSKDFYDRFKGSTKMFFPGAVRYGKYSKFSFYPIAGRTIRVLYSGVFEYVTGVDLLLEAIKLIDKQNIEFVFSGRGVLSDSIKKAARDDKRIRLEGFLPRDEYYRLLNSADILINPRNMNFKQNANNFPSKMLEYLAAGKCIVSTRFAGYECFGDCRIKYVDSDSSSIAAGICNAIYELPACQEEIFVQNHVYAKRFDWSSQALKILDFL